VKLLLIRLRLVGDVVFTTPAIRALRRALPDAHLTYLVEPSAAPVVQHSPYLDEVIVCSGPDGARRLRADVRLARDLRARRFDVVLDFHGGPRATWLTLATGAPRRFGYAVAGRSWVYTTVVDRPRALRARHSVENQWDLVEAFLPGLGRPTPVCNPVEMPESPNAARRMTDWLARHEIGSRHDLVIIHVSAGNPFRRWPLSAFAELAARLSSSAPERRIILTSGPSEAEASAEVAHLAAEMAPDRRHAITTCGDSTLAELRSLIGRAALFIGGDSGPLHVAATTSTPIVGLYGPTLPERSAPWRDPALVTESVDAGPLPCRPCDQRRCVPGDFRCLTHLEAACVADAAERALARAAQVAAGRLP
jgi:lipopolysaccharide heptosyltransferase II